MSTLSLYISGVSIVPVLRRFFDRLDLGNALTVWYSLFSKCMYYHTFDITDITL